MELCESLEVITQVLFCCQEEVLDELWNQVEAVTDAPFPEVGGCKHRPGGCSPLTPNQVRHVVLNAGLVWSDWSEACCHVALFWCAQ